MCNVTNNQKNQPRPVAVFVISSNANELKPGKKYTFSEFENRALCVALANAGGQSQKIEIEVLFINNTRIFFSLELGQRDHSKLLYLGFYDYCYQSLKALKKRIRETNKQEAIRNNFLNAPFDILKSVFIDVAEVAKANALLKIAKKHGKDHNIILSYLAKS